ncbi:MAG TPA: GNAT family N-acetyltransferase [Caulobacteraceae bacterium]|nr:GNAT family N-acetyltransferase [Caulobacteraceae bacterium]
MGTPQVRDNAAAGRFELEEAGQVVFADYRSGGGRLFIDHVEAPPALRGTGAASRLMAGVAAIAEREGSTIVPICSYAAAWLARRGGRTG